jgi:Matrixin
VAEFTRVFRVQGMDSNATPRFQMVPERGNRFVALRDSGTGATVTIDDPTVCTITEVRERDLPVDERLPAVRGDRLFKLHGVNAGVATVTATGGSIAAPLELEVSVKTKRQQLIAFNFLRDNAGHRTLRPASVVAELMGTLNYIWRRQANVELVNHVIRRPTVAENLGDPILLPQGSLGTRGQTIGAAGLTTVDLNVFFVWNLQEDGNSADVDAVTTLNTAGTGAPGTCIFEDRAGRAVGVTLAHEIGHHLGLNHTGHRQIDLMFDFTDQRGFNLTKDDVNTANP